MALGFNLATAVHKVFYYLRLNKIGSKNPTYLDVIDFLNQALEEVYETLAAEGMGLETDSHQYSVVADDESYALSALTNQLGKYITRIWYAPESETDGYNLTYFPFSDLFRRHRLPGSTRDTGRPTIFSVDDDADNIVLWRTPDESTTNGLTVYFPTVPDLLERYWGTPVSSAVRANVTNASANVTLSASGTGQILATDAFGVIPTKLGLPPRFYTVSTIDAGGTAVVLTENYAGATDTAAMFVTGQKFPLGTSYPNRAMAIVWRAVYNALLSMPGQENRALLFYNDDPPFQSRKEAHYQEEIRKLLMERNYAQSRYTTANR